MQTRAKIIWADDEIDQLKPHIISLEEKGYQVKAVSNGWDAINSLKLDSFDLILMDHFMPGIDGIEAVRQIKGFKPELPVIMITKSEEEWLMDEAISEQVREYLIKPVNPTQIFSACKRVLEKNQIIADRTTGDYLKEFRIIDEKIQTELNVDEWWELYNKLITWQLAFDTQHKAELQNILIEQLESCNREFVRFIENNYIQWMKSDKRPTLSPDIIPKFCIPKLRSKERVCLIVIDCLRHDQLMAIMPEISRYFEVETDFVVSILPSATPFARNAIFSGLFPDRLLTKYPQQRKLLENHEKYQNQFEQDYLTDLLKRFNLSQLNTHFQKLWTVERGLKFSNRFSDIMNNDFIAIVINFVDNLAHQRSESEVLKEMVPNETGYRQAVRNWFKNSWFFTCLKQLADSEFQVIITSDHGSIRVQKGALVSADRNTSLGVRYKYGRNLNCNDKNALIIDQPSLYRLPLMGPQSSYLIAKNDAYFLYPNQLHQYQSMLKDSFQHGGISMEEMLVPVATLTGK